MRNILYVITVALLAVIVIISVSFSEKPIFAETQNTEKQEITTKKIQTFLGSTITITNTHPKSKELSTVTIETTGFSSDETITLENYPLTDIFFVDINNDVYEELILVFTSTEESKQAEIALFTTHDNIGLTKIETPLIDSDSTSEGKPFEGYLGFDTFTLQSSKLVHSFRTTTLGTPIVRKKEYLKQLPVQNNKEEDTEPAASSTQPTPQVLGVATTTEEAPQDDSFLIDPFAPQEEPPVVNTESNEDTTKQDPFAENKEELVEEEPPYFTRSFIYRLIDEQNTFTIEIEELLDSHSTNVSSSTFLLSGSVWEWVSAVAQNNKVVTPKKKQAFILSFSTPETFVSSTDCGEFSGSYIAGGGFLTFGNFAQNTATAQECKDSQTEDYKNLLMSVEGYSVRGNKLFLNLPEERTMIFSK